MDEIHFSQETEVVLIPDGLPQLLPEGTRGWITQVLGGNFTVQLETGRLVRVAAKDAAVIGQDSAMLHPELDADTVIDEELVWEQLRQVYDPEIPINIVELGLVYHLEVIELDEDGGFEVDVTMTLTAPGCGMGQVLADDVEFRIRSLPNVVETRVELVFEPPWSAMRMTEEARLELGMVW